MRALHYSDKTDTRFWELYQQCEILVSTGDLTLFDFGLLRDLSADQRKPAFGVYGNHDSGRYFEELGIVNLHDRVVEWGGLRWGGFQGCLRYKQGDAPMFDEGEARVWAERFPAVDVLLLHAGPFGMLDDSSDTTHVGSVAVRDYVLRARPRVVFCGHQYSDDEMETDGIHLYRTYGARLLSVDL